MRLIPQRALAEPVFEWGRIALYQGDCRDWLKAQPANSIHAVVTDPPYSTLEYTAKEIAKLRAGRGGVWRIPPAMGGHNRRPVPRFSVLSASDIHRLYQFFSDWGRLLLRVLVPGAHVFVASTPLLSYQLSRAMAEAGYQKRGEVVRIVRTLRGGDRPKGAESEFPDISASPRSCWEPWVIFRKPLDGTLAENLRAWAAGGLRRPARDVPFADVIPSGRTPSAERQIAPHPSLKPQGFLRALVSASLLSQSGTLLDPFAGSGSTLAACAALGYQAIGVESDDHYVEMAKEAIPRLAQLYASDRPRAKKRKLFSPPSSRESTTQQLGLSSLV
jgi:site-specific DNA-methyltransferase (adenine-specific)